MKGMEWKTNKQTTHQACEKNECLAHSLRCCHLKMTTNKVQDLKCKRIRLKMNSIESTAVMLHRTEEYLVCRYVCAVFQPGNLTG